ncbi:hsp70 nucleotide exchange factor fes1 [Sorochytrium milnesiophthora]
MATLQDLLKWGIENATRGEDAPASTRPPPQPLDPKWIEVVLGKPDAARMRDAVTIAVDADHTHSLDDRLTALDELLLLVESIDNARDLQALKLWPSLLSLLVEGLDGGAEELADVRMGSAWAVATSVQNNPDAVEAFLAADGIDKLADAVDREHNPAALAKLASIVSVLASQRTDLIRQMYAKEILSTLGAMLLPEKSASVSPQLTKKLLHMFAHIIASAPPIAVLFRDTVNDIVMQQCSTLGNNAQQNEIDADTLETLLRFVNACWAAHIRIDDTARRALTKLVEPFQKVPESEAPLDMDIVREFLGQQH